MLLGLWRAACHRESLRSLVGWKRRNLTLRYLHAAAGGVRLQRCLVGCAGRYRDLRRLVGRAEMSRLLLYHYGGRVGGDVCAARAMARSERGCCYAPPEEGGAGAAPTPHQRRGGSGAASTPPPRREGRGWLLRLRFLAGAARLLRLLRGGAERARLLRCLRARSAVFSRSSRGRRGFSDTAA